MRKITFMWKWNGSGVNNCPALYETDGGYVVQGIVLSEADRAQLHHVGADETAVFVPADVLDRLREAI